MTFGPATKSWTRVAADWANEKENFKTSHVQPLVRRGTAPHEGHALACLLMVCLQSLHRVSAINFYDLMTI